MAPALTPTALGRVMRIITQIGLMFLPQRSLHLMLTHASTAATGPTTTVIRTVAPTTMMAKERLLTLPPVAPVALAPSQRAAQARNKHHL